MSVSLFPGRLLGLDYGLKVIGVAVSDPTGLLASPLRLIYRRSKAEDFALINTLAAEQQTVGIVVGLPESPPYITVYTAADRVRLWAGRLAAAVSIPVYLWNERYSSQEAAELLAETGQPLPERLDAAAAAVILQAFLDAHRDTARSWPDPVPPVQN